MAKKMEQVKMEQVQPNEPTIQQTSQIDAAKIIGGDRIVLTVRGKAVDKYPLLEVFDTRGMRFQVVGISTMDAENYSVELARVG